MSDGVERNFVPGNILNDRDMTINIRFKRGKNVRYVYSQGENRN